MTDLGACKNYCLAKILQHKGEGRGRVRHGVSAMENDKTIEVMIMCADIFSDSGPVFHGQVAGIQQGVVLNNGV